MLITDSQSYTRARFHLFEAIFKRLGAVWKGCLSCVTCSHHHLKLGQWTLSPEYFSPSLSKAAQASVLFHIQVPGRAVWFSVYIIFPYETTKILLALGVKNVNDGISFKRSHESHCTFFKTMSTELTLNHFWGHGTGLSFNSNSRINSGVYFFWCHVVPIKVYHLWMCWLT